MAVVVTERGSEGSGFSESVLRWVRSHYPPPKIRTYRRVETPPGAHAQTDWAEYLRVDPGEGPEELSALVMVLSHSRMPSVVWSRAKDELSWLAAHNGSFRRLAGVAAVNRIDNVETAIAKGAGRGARSTRPTGPPRRRSGSTSTPAAPGGRSRRGRRRRRST
jgi:hypothetical protein